MSGKNGLTDAVKAMDLCWKNSDRFLKAALREFDAGDYSIAFHLAVIALEELGKRSLVAMTAASDEEESLGYFAKATQNHGKKIFWAIFGGYILHNKIDEASIEKTRGLSKKLHNRRLRAMYVDITDEEIMDPIDSVTQLECSDFMQFVQNKLDVDRIYGLPQTEDQQKEFFWFQRNFENPLVMSVIASTTSLEKLAESGPTAWRVWVKAESEKQIRQSEEYLKIESELVPPDDRIAKKWHAKLCLRSDTHAFKQSVLQKWNEQCKFLTLNVIDNKKHKSKISVELSIPPAITLDNLHGQAISVMEKFVLAMNVGTQGLFWWTDRGPTIQPFDSMRDVVANMPLQGKSSSPKFTQLVDSQGRQTARQLSETELNTVVLCFYALAYQPKPSDIETLKFYLTGLVNLWKTDLLWWHTHEAARGFLLCLDSLLKQNNFGDLTLNSSNTELVNKLSNIFQKDKTMEQLEKVQKALEANLVITYTEVFILKLICDVLLVEQLVGRMNTLSQDAWVDKTHGP